MLAAVPRSISCSPLSLSSSLQLARRSLKVLGVLALLVFETFMTWRMGDRQKKIDTAAAGMHQPVSALTSV